MPAIPSASETVRDYGLGITQPASLTPLVIGVSSLGATNTVEQYSTPNALREGRGEGPAVETAANILAKGGGPVAFCGTESSIAASNGQMLPTYSATGSNGAITKTDAGPAIAITGTPNGSYDMQIEITTAGALETAAFRWSIDNGATWVAEGITTAADGVHELATDAFDTGLTATFASGTYVLNETYSWTTTPGGGSIAVSGDATIDALLRVEILTSGALGVARFRYSVDGYSGDTASERTYSETLYVPAGGTFTIPGLGVTLTFSVTPTDFVAGDAYLCAVECAASNASNLSSAFTAIQASPVRWRYAVVVTSKGNGDATAHALLGVALQAHLDTLAATSKYRRAMMAATHEDTAAASLDAWDDVVAIRLLVAHGQVRRATVKPYSGFAFPVTNAVDVIAARAAALQPSTDLKRVRSGPLSEVVKIFHDEYRAPSSLDDVKVSTLRSFENRAGYFITQGRLKSPDGSDFTHWPRGIVMDIACETVNAALTEEIGRGVRYETREVDGTAYEGTVDERDATVIEQSVASALIAQLSTPQNEEGFEGHVTDLRYTISRTHNVVATGTIIGQVSIKGLGYVDYVTTTLGYVVDIQDAA